MTTQRFRTTLLLAGKTATGIEIPPAVIEALGAGRKPPVAVTIGDYTYPSTVAVMGGKFMVAVSAEHRTAAGIAAGDELDVEIALDAAPRTVELPADLAEALDADPAVRAAFDRLAFSHRKEHVRAINDAKTDETRQRRIAKAVAKVRGD